MLAVEHAGREEGVQARVEARVLEVVSLHEYEEPLEREQRVDAAARIAVREQVAELQRPRHVREHGGG